MATQRRSYLTFIKLHMTVAKLFLFDFFLFLVFRWCVALLGNFLFGFLTVSQRFSPKEIQGPREATEINLFLNRKIPNLDIICQFEKNPEKG